MNKVGVHGDVMDHSEAPVNCLGVRLVALVHSPAPQFGASHRGVIKNKNCVMHVCMGAARTFSFKLRTFLTHEEVVEGTQWLRMR